MFLYVDIETIPAQSADAKARIAANVKAPGNIKKADSLATWEKEQKPAAVEEAISRSGLNAAYGHICCIGLAADDGDVSSISWPLNASSETEVIKGFFEVAGKLAGNRFPVIVGHNVAGFDIRFIWQRCIALGIHGPAWFPRDPKPWGDDVFDTMTAWAGARDTISMDNLCAALGVPGKGDIDGSMVGQLFAEGRHKEIAAYCRDDIERTRAIHRKMMVAFGEVVAA